MSEKNIDINDLNAGEDFRLGALYNPTPEQTEPKLNYNATTNFNVGRSFHNLIPGFFSLFPGPYQNDWSQASAATRAGLAPDTTLSSIKNLGNWSYNQYSQAQLSPNILPMMSSALDEDQRIQTLLGGGATSGVVGRAVDPTATIRTKMGYGDMPYYQINPTRPMFENMDTIELDHNKYLTYINQKNTSDRLLAEQNKTPVPQSIVPMTKQEFMDARKERQSQGAMALWSDNLNAENGLFSGSSILSGIINWDTTLGLTSPESKTIPGFKLAQYASPYDITENPVQSVAKDVVEYISKEDPNFDGPTWFKQLDLPLEVRHALLQHNITDTSFVGARGKNEALYVLQDSLWTSTLRDKHENFLKNNEFFKTTLGSISMLPISMPNMIVSDPDAPIQVGVSLASLGISLVGSGTILAARMANNLSVAAKAATAMEKINLGLGTASAIATGGIPVFLRTASATKQLAWAASTGALIMAARNLKDQSNKIAFSTAGLELQGQYSYNLSELSHAAVEGLGFGIGMHAIHEVTGALKRSFGPNEPNNSLTNTLFSALKNTVTGSDFVINGKKVNKVDRYFSNFNSQLSDALGNDSANTSSYPFLNRYALVLSPSDLNNYDKVSLGPTPELQLHLNNLEKTIVDENSIDTTPFQTYKNVVIDGVTHRFIENEVRTVSDLSTNKPIDKATTIRTDTRQRLKSSRITDFQLQITDELAKEISSMGNWDGIKKLDEGPIDSSPRLSKKWIQWKEKAKQNNIELIDDTHGAGKELGILDNLDRVSTQSLERAKDLTDNLKATDPKEIEIKSVETTNAISNKNETRILLSTKRTTRGNLLAELEKRKVLEIETQTKLVEEQNKLRNIDDNLYIQTPEGTVEVSKVSAIEARIRAEEEQSKLISPEVTEVEKLASAKDTFSDRSTIVESTDLATEPESATFSRVPGESVLRYAVRLLNSDQIKSIADALVITKDFGTGILESTKKLLVLEKLKNILEHIETNRNEPYGSDGRFLDSTIDSLPNLINEVKKLIKTHEDSLVQEVNDAYDGEFVNSLTRQEKITFNEDLIYQRVKLDPTYGPIPDPKEIYNSLNKAVSDGVFSQKYRDAIVKDLTMRGDLPIETKVEPIIKDPVLQRTKRMGTLNTENTVKRLTAVKKFSKKEQAKARDAYNKPYGNNKVKNGFIRSFSNRLLELGTPLETRLEAVRLLSASLANLELKPAQLIEWEDTLSKLNQDELAIGGYARPVSLDPLSTGFGFSFDATKKATLQSNFASESVKVVLHELGHIYSFLLQPKEMNKVYNLYTDHVSLSFLEKFNNIETATAKASPLGMQYTSPDWYNFKDVNEFFANIFEQNLSIQTIAALKETPKQLSLDMLSMLNYFKNTWNSIKNLVSDNSIVSLTTEMNRIIKKIDKVSYRTVTDSANLSTDVSLIQLEISKRLNKKLSNFNGLLSINNYTQSLTSSLVEQLDNPSILEKLVDLVPHASKEARAISLQTIKQEMITGIDSLIKTPLRINEADVLNQIFFKDSGLSSKELFLTRLSSLLTNEKNNGLVSSADSVISKHTKRIGKNYGIQFDPESFISDNKELNSLNSKIKIATFFLPNRVSEILQTLHADSSSFITNDLIAVTDPFTKEQTTPFLIKYLELKKINDSYKATSIAYALPNTITDAESFNAYRNFASVAEFVKALGTDQISIDDMLVKLSKSNQYEQVASPMVGDYLQQFLFLNDILDNLDKTYGIKLKTEQSIFEKDLGYDTKEYINSLITNPFITDDTKYQIIKSSINGGKQKHSYTTFFQVAAELDTGTELKSMVKAFLSDLNLSDFDFDTKLKDTVSRLLDTKNIDTITTETKTMFKLAKLIADKILAPEKEIIIEQNIKIRKKLLKDNPELIKKLLAKEEVAKVTTQEIIQPPKETLTVEEEVAASNNWKENPQAKADANNKNYYDLSEGNDLTIKDIASIMAIPKSKLNNILVNILNGLGVRNSNNQVGLISDLYTSILDENSSQRKLFETILASGKDINKQIIGASKRLLSNKVIDAARKKTQRSSTGEKQQKIVSAIDSEGNQIDFKAVINDRQVMTEKRIQEASLRVQQLDLTTDVKEKIIKWMQFKLNTNGATNKSIAKQMGISEDSLNKITRRYSKAMEKAGISLSVVDDSITNIITPKELATRQIKKIVEDATIEAVQDPKKAAQKAVKSLRQRISESDRRKTTAKIFEDTNTKTSSEPVVSMPVVKDKVALYATTLTGDSESVPSGTALLPQDIATTIAEVNQSDVTTQVIVEPTNKTIILNSGSNIIESLQNTPVEILEKQGIEKDILIETLSSVPNPEEVLLKILNEQGLDTITVVDTATKKKRAVVTVSDKVAKVTEVLDNKVESPLLRKPGTKPIVKDPTIIVDSIVKNPEKETIMFTETTGESPDMEPKIITGPSDMVKLSPIDKFDSEVMSGKETLRLSGTDPKFVKYFLLKFNKLSAGLIKNINVKLEGIPVEFETLLDTINSYYTTISEHNRVAFGNKFEAINKIFWANFDKEVVAELGNRATPLSESKPKRLGEIIKQASDKTNEIIRSNNVQQNTTLPDFLPPISPDDFIVNPLDAKESSYVTEVRLRPKSEGLRLFNLTNKKRSTAKSIADTFKLKTVEPVEVTKPVDIAINAIGDLIKKYDAAQKAKQSESTAKVLRNFWEGMNDNTTMHHTTLTWSSMLFRGSFTADANIMEKFMRASSEIIQSRSGEGKTIRSLSNIIRWMSAMTENGKLMSHQLVKSSTGAFKTFEGCSHQNLRELIPVLDAQNKFDNAVGHVAMARDLQWHMIESKVNSNGKLDPIVIEQIIKQYKPTASKEFIANVIETSKALQQVDINDNTLLIALEAQTKWGRMVDRNGKQMNASKYHSMTIDANRVMESNRGTILQAFVEARTNTLLSEQELDGNIMIAMGWLTENDKKSSTMWSTAGRTGTHIELMSESPFDSTTLTTLEAKAKVDGNNRYAPDTDLNKIWQLNPEHSGKYFSYIDPATQEVVICAMPETKSELSAGDLIKYNETINGKLDHLSNFWKERFPNKAVLPVTMEELLQYKTREGKYSPHHTTVDQGRATLSLFGNSGTYEGFAVRNLSIEEVLSSPAIKDIMRYNYYETKKNFRKSRGFELLVQREIDRATGTTGIRATRFFKSGLDLALEYAGTDSPLSDAINQGFSRIADDYNSYADNLPMLNSTYDKANTIGSNAATSIIKIASSPRWAMRSLAEPTLLIINDFLGGHPIDATRELYTVLKQFFSRGLKTYNKNAINTLIFGIREEANHQHRFMSEYEDTNTSSTNRNTWLSRLLKTKEGTNPVQKALDITSNIMHEAGGNQYLSSGARQIAMVQMVRQMVNNLEPARRLAIELDKPENLAAAAKESKLSRTSKAGSIGVGKHFITLARVNGFGGDWATAVSFARFNLLNVETLDALQYAFKEIGIVDGNVSMEALRNWEQAYATNGIGPIAKDVMHQAYHDFCYAIEIKITTDGAISEARGLNRDLSISSRTPWGRFMKGLMQWSTSYQSNVLQNGGLMTPAAFILKTYLAYNTLVYISDLLVEFAQGRNPNDIIKELQDPTTFIPRMISETPVMGRYQSLLSESLASVSALSGGKFHSFGISPNVPAVTVLSSYVSKIGKSAHALATNDKLTAPEILAHIGNIIPVNNLINGTPIGFGVSSLQQMGLIEKHDAIDTYLKVARGGLAKDRYAGTPSIKDKQVSTFDRGSETPYEQQQRQLAEKQRLLDRLNKSTIAPKLTNPTIVNIKGVSYDLSKKLEELGNH